MVERGSSVYIFDIVQEQLIELLKTFEYQTLWKLMKYNNYGVSFCWLGRDVRVGKDRKESNGQDYIGTKTKR